MSWKELDRDQFELLTQEYDFYVSRNGNLWVLDIFDYGIEDNSLAYIESFGFDTLKEAKTEAENFIPA